MAVVGRGVGVLFCEIAQRLEGLVLFVVGRDFWGFRGWCFGRAGEEKRKGGAGRVLESRRRAFLLWRGCRGWIGIIHSLYVSLFLLLHSLLEDGMERLEWDKRSKQW